MRNHSLTLKIKYHYHVFVHLWWSLKFHFKKISAMTKLEKFLELGSLGLGEIFFTTLFLPVALTREALPHPVPSHTHTSAQTLSWQPLQSLLQSSGLFLLGGTAHIFSLTANHLPLQSALKCLFDLPDMLHTYASPGG